MIIYPEIIRNEWLKPLKHSKKSISEFFDLAIMP